MFYKIDNNYYVLVEHQYIQVRFINEGDNLRAIPTSNKFEKTPQVKAIEKSFDEIKKELQKPKTSFEERPIRKRYKHND